MQCREHPGTLTVTHGPVSPFYLKSDDHKHEHSDNFSNVLRQFAFELISFKFLKNNQANDICYIHYEDEIPKKML
jgi:hypothetical protein